MNQNRPATSALAASVAIAIAYIGAKESKTDAATGITWHGYGDVQVVSDPRAAARLLEHGDVWVRADRKLPPRQLSADPLLKDPDQQPTTAPTPMTPEEEEEAFLSSMLASLPRFVTMLRADRELASAIAGDFGLQLAAPVPAEPNDAPAAGQADAGMEANEREVLLENLRREADALGIESKGNWGVPKLTAEIAAARERQAANGASNDVA